MVDASACLLMTIDWQPAAVRVFTLLPMEIWSFRCRSSTTTSTGNSGWLSRPIQVGSLATTRMLGWCASRAAMPSRTRAWSSTTATRIAPSRAGTLPTAAPFASRRPRVRATLAPTLMSSSDEAHQLCADNVFFDEEPVVAELGVYDHRGISIDVVGKVPGDLRLTLHREQPVAVDADDEAGGGHTTQGPLDPATVSTDVV